MGSRIRASACILLSYHRARPALLYFVVKRHDACVILKSCPYPVLVSSPTFVSTDKRSPRRQRWPDVCMTLSAPSIVHRKRSRPSCEASVRVYGIGHDLSRHIVTFLRVIELICLNGRQLGSSSTGRRDIVFSISTWPNVPAKIETTLTFPYMTYSKSAAIP